MRITGERAVQYTMREEKSAQTAAWCLEFIVVIAGIMVVRVDNNSDDLDTSGF